MRTCAAARPGRSMISSTMPLASATGVSRCFCPANLKLDQFDPTAGNASLTRFSVCEQTVGLWPVIRAIVSMTLTRGGSSAVLRTCRTVASLTWPKHIIRFGIGLIAFFYLGSESPFERACGRKLDQFDPTVGRRSLATRVAPNTLLGALPASRAAWLPSVGLLHLASPGFPLGDGPGVPPESLGFPQARAHWL